MPKPKLKTYVSPRSEGCVAKLIVTEESKDGIFEHNRLELDLTIRSDDGPRPALWKIRWRGTLTFLQATLPKYVKEHCPDPENAANVLGWLASDEFGIFFPSYWGKPASWSKGSSLRRNGAEATE